MKEKAKNLWQVLRDAVGNWSDHDATTHSAALAYVCLFSLAPVLILAIAVAGWAYGPEAARGEVQRELGRFIGADGARVIESIVAAASNRQRSGSWAALLGGITLVVSATGVLMQLQESLNTVWEVVPKPGFFLRRLLLKRLLCFGLILVVGVLLVASIAASAALSVVQRFLEARFELTLATALGWADRLISWILMTLLIALLYRVLPDVEIRWREVIWGSAFTSILFLTGKSVIGFYLQRTGLMTTFGAAGSLVLILVWVYYSSLIFLLGAELTRVHSRRYRDGRAPASPGAERAKKITVPVDAKAPEVAAR